MGTDVLKSKQKVTKLVSLVNNGGEYAKCIKYLQYPCWVHDLPGRERHISMVGFPKRDRRAGMREERKIEDDAEESKGITKTRLLQYIENFTSKN